MRAVTYGGIGAATLMGCEISKLPKMEAQIAECLEKVRKKNSKNWDTLFAEKTKIHFEELNKLRLGKRMPREEFVPKAQKSI